MKRMAENGPRRAAGSPACAESAHTGAAGPAPPRLSESIESRENRWLKRFRAVLAGESPEQGKSSGIPGDLLGVEGARMVETALRSGVEVLAVLFSETGTKYASRLAELISTEARVLRTTDRLFASVAGTETPQGLAALVRPRVATFDDLVGGIPLVLVLAGVQDPGNVGTLVRTAEAFGASGVAACAARAIGTANPFAPKALRASAGSALRLPIFRGMSAPVLLAQMKIAGVCTYAACPEDVVSSGGAGDSAREPLAPWEVDWRKPSALLIGNEGAGLPSDLVRSADGIVRIPQPTPSAFVEGGDQQSARGESLNAGIAGSILLYEAAKQRLALR
jgi:TrmH family RNA methyltransferase